MKKIYILIILIIAALVLMTLYVYPSLTLKKCDSTLERKIYLSFDNGYITGGETVTAYINLDTNSCNNKKVIVWAAFIDEILGECVLTNDNCNFIFTAPTNPDEYSLIPIIDLNNNNKRSTGEPGGKPSVLRVGCEYAPMFGSEMTSKVSPGNLVTANIRISDTNRTYDVCNGRTAAVSNFKDNLKNQKFIWSCQILKDSCLITFHAPESPGNYSYAVYMDLNNNKNAETWPFEPGVTFKLEVI